MTKQKIQVALVDDHQMVLDGIGHMLGSYPFIQLVGSYITGNALLAGLEKVQPDVLLLDIHLTDFVGEDLVPLLTQRYPGMRILAITSMDNTNRVRNLIRMGCLGYLLKNTAAHTLADAIQTVYKGVSYIAPDVKEQILRDTLQLKTEMPAQSVLLTRREKEILQLICKAHSSKEIADQLFISLNTVENHRKRLFQKMNVKNMAGLVRKALAIGLVD